MKTRYIAAALLVGLIGSAVAGDAYLRHQRDITCAPVVFAGKSFHYSCDPYSATWRAGDQMWFLDFYGYEGSPFRVRYERLAPRAAEPIAVASPATPAKTANGADSTSSVFTELYEAEMELSKANMDASKAEESLSKSVHRMAVSCGIAMIATLCFLVGAIGVLASKKRYRS